MSGGTHLENANPLIFQRSGERLLTATDEDEDVHDPIDDREIFMTLEQEYRHAAERRAQNWLKIKETKFANFPEHKRITDHLSHLNITKTWSN